VEKTSRIIIDDLITTLKISEILARVLYDEYLRDSRDIAKLTPEEMNKITSISVEDCRLIIEKAAAIVENQKRQDLLPEGQDLLPEGQDLLPEGQDSPEQSEAEKEETNTNS